MSKLTKNLPHVARYLLGFGFVVFGLNFFLHFLPQPKDIPPAAGAFVGALIASGYVMNVVKSIEVVAGLLLLSNRFVPLALTLLAPLLVAIVGFHAFLAPAGLPVAVVFLALELYLAYSYREAYAPMLKSRVAPATQTQRATSDSHAYA